MNSNWKFIETEKDLPRERTDIWVVCQGKVRMYNDFEPNNERCIKYCLENYSYWQKVIKPEFSPFNRSNQAER